MATDLKELRILCVGTVHDGFMAVRFAERKTESDEQQLSEAELQRIEEDHIEYLEDQADRDFWATGRW